MLAAVILCSSACNQSSSAWEDREMWYGTENASVNDDVDVLYILSTEVLSARNDDGTASWRSLLSDEDKAAMKGEIDWVGKNMFSDGFHLVAPYYHQFTFDAISQLDRERFDDLYSEVAEEVCGAFDYYMEHINRRRPFILAGFSQGAMLCLDLLRHMSDREYSRMIACYCIGYRLSEEDLRHPHIKAAEGEDGKGVVISFNSTLSREAVWPLVGGDAATCINPVNWQTDTTRAELRFDGTVNTIGVDPETNTLLVETDSPEYFHRYYEQATFFGDAGVNPDNLHHWDLLFYPQQIHDNALLRAGKKSGGR